MKQNTANVRAPKTGVIKAKGTTVNADGLAATKRSKKSELFLLGVGRFFGETTFYTESEDRFRNLVRDVTRKDPEWVAAYLKWLRNDANIRTAAIVGAAEYVKAGGPNGRAVVKSVIVRGDEPAEMLAYWIGNYGKRIPQPIKRGIADSATRLYTERNYSKWDGGKGAVKMADVIELTHPRPADERQSQLFKFILDDRRGNGDLDTVKWIRQARGCKTRFNYAVALELGNPCITWENVSSAESGKMSAEQWVAMYNHMGYMAKLRNLRNLDQAGVSRNDKRTIGSWLADADNVAKSRQLPMRFYSAYKSVEDDVWAGYLDEALEHSLKNVPVVNGNWLVLVDASGSMTWNFSENGSVNYYEAATVFAAAFARANNADIRTYSNSLSPVLSAGGKNVLRIVKELRGNQYYFGGGTNTEHCLRNAFKEGKYDGVLLLTDEQYNGGSWAYGGDPSRAIPKDVPLYTFNLAGYRAGHDIGVNRVTVGGLSDAGFTMIAAVENAKARWPWE